MRRLVAALILLAPVAAYAGAFPIPSDDPLATITIPPKWE